MRYAMEYWRVGHFPWRSGFLVVMLAASVLACGARSAPVDRPEPVATSVDEGAARLVLDNSSIWDVRIFVVRSTQNVRLGVVGSGQQATFTLRRDLVGRELIFLAEPIGARERLRTDAIVVRPGVEVRLSLEKRLRSYGLAIY